MSVFNKFLERREPRVFPLRLAAAIGSIQVRPAFGAQPAARLRAERLHRQRELKLLAQHLDDVQRPFAVVRGRQIVFGDFALPGRRRSGRRARSAARIARRRAAESVEAPAALELERCRRPAGDAKRIAAGLFDVHRDLDRRGHR